MLRSGRTSIVRQKTGVAANAREWIADGARGDRPRSVAHEAVHGMIDREIMIISTSDNDHSDSNADLSSDTA